VVQQLLDGGFRETFRISLGHDELPLLDAAKGREGDEVRLRWVHLVGSMDDPRRIPLLLELWASTEGRAHAVARDLLRAQDAARVLPRIRPALEGGDASALDVIGPTRHLPRWLTRACTRWAGDWERFFTRVSGGGLLFAPGLAELALTAIHDAPTDPGGALRILVRLEDWRDPAVALRLADAVEPVLVGAAREPLLAAILEAAAAHDVDVRTTLLTRLGRPSDAAWRLAVTDAVLQSSDVLATLPAGMAAAVERELDREAEGRHVERARKILDYRAREARTDLARAALLDLLERSLAHRSARVRLHALRLMRAHADRGRYVTAARALLDDPDPTTVRSAVRIVSYGADLDAVGPLADLVSHGDARVRAAAREGLLTLGEGAVAALRGAIARARPDRRAALVAVLEEIQGETG
jgi:hypothetical protein